MRDSRPNEQSLRVALRERMGAWGLPANQDYENEVIARALTEPAPEIHAHWHEEMGMCTDCDAAAVLAETSGDPESSR